MLAAAVSLQKFSDTSVNFIFRRLRLDTDLQPCVFVQPCVFPLINTVVSHCGSWKLKRRKSMSIRALTSKYLKEVMCKNDTQCSINDYCIPISKQWRASVVSIVIFFQLSDLKCFCNQKRETQ